jgi:hypothetical protein
MSLSDLASLGSFISGVGVFISLIFLYFQLRQVNAQVGQAEKNQQAAIRQERSARVSEIDMSAADPSLAETIAKGTAGSPDLTRIQLAQCLSYTNARLVISEDAFYQHKNGLLSEEAFASFVRHFGGAFAMPGPRVLWRWVKAGYGAEFVAFVDDLIAQTPVALPSDLLARWTSDIAAEKAAGFITPAT